MKSAVRDRRYSLLHAQFHDDRLFATLVVLDGASDLSFPGGWKFIFRKKLGPSGFPVSQEGKTRGRASASGAKNVISSIGGFLAIACCLGTVRCDGQSRRIDLIVTIEEREPLGWTTSLALQVIPSKVAVSH